MDDLNAEPVYIFGRGDSRVQNIDWFCRVRIQMNSVLYTSMLNDLFIQRLLSTLMVTLQILGRKFNKNTKISSLYSQCLLIFIHRSPVVERHPLTREIRDLLWPRSTPTGNTVYFYMSSSLIYTLKIHRRSFKHSVR